MFDNFDKHYEQMKRFNNPSFKEMKALMDDDSKLKIIMYHLSKEEVVNKDFKQFDGFMTNLKKIGKKARQTAIITCGGYDDVPDELFQIQEVREFVNELFKRYPYILYYTNPELEGDVWLITSFADEVTSVAESQYSNMTAKELFEKFGFDNIPRVNSYLTFKNQKLEHIFKAILKHGKNNKDIRGAKKIVIERAITFENTMGILNDVGITMEDLIELGYVKE